MLKKLTLTIGLIIAPQIWSDITTTEINLICTGINTTLCPKEEGCATFPKSAFEDDPEVDPMSDISLSFVKTTIKDVGDYYSAKWGVMETADVEETGNILFSTFDTSILGGEYVGTEMIYNLDKVSLKYWRIVREKASERRMVQNNYQCKEAKKNPFGN
jgi:hypothetical protein